MANYVSTSDNKRKILSTAQDLVHFSSKGKRAMPKHVAIDITMRHMTGSSTILGILNGLGHSSGHSTVLEHDTALATKQLERKTIVSEGFAKRVHTTVVGTIMILGRKLQLGVGQPTIPMVFCVKCLRQGRMGPNHPLQLLGNLLH